MLYEVITIDAFGPREDDQGGLVVVSREAVGALDTVTLVLDFAGAPTGLSYNFV